MSETLHDEGAGSDWRETFLARTTPSFAVVASLTYFLSMGFNVAPFAYYPEVGEFHVSAQPESLGPPMFWYGWILYGAMAGAIAAAITLMMPRRWAAALAGRHSWLVWAVPVLVILTTIYFLKSFFT